MLITEMDDGFCALQGARDMQPSSCSVGDSCPPVQGRTNAHGNHDPLVPYLTPGVFRNRTTNLQLASVFMDFRLLLLSPSTSYRDSSQIFGACRDCTKPSKYKEARTFIITESQLPLSQLYNPYLLFSAKVRKIHSPPMCIMLLDFILTVVLISS